MASVDGIEVHFTLVQIQYTLLILVQFVYLTVLDSLAVYHALLGLLLRTLVGFIVLFIKVFFVVIIVVGFIVFL